MANGSRGETDNGKGPRLNVAQEAARVGVALKEGPLTIHDIAVIISGRSEYEWDQLRDFQQEYYKNRARHLITSISGVNGLPVAEDLIDGRLVFFLLDTS